jgi:uncharacterized Ntn-hydrolase superfamily protein
MTRTHPRPSTFSIVACDSKAGEWGVGVASKFLAAGAIVPWAKAGAGAIATQAWVNLSYGPDGLALLEAGHPAAEVVGRLTRADERRDSRQMGVVDASGQAAAWTGKDCTPWAGHIVGEGYACQGNILGHEGVATSMALAFENETRPLPERLLAALAAGQAAGGDSRGQQSAALYVVKAGGSYGGYLDRYVDLRVDDHAAPVDELRRLLELHRLYFGATDVGRLSRLSGSVASAVQEMLAKAGYYTGPVDGVYSPQTKTALRRWCGIENFEERFREDDLIDGEILSFMRRKYGS